MGSLEKRLDKLEDKVSKDLNVSIETLKENNSKNTEELSNFQKELNQLNVPYKKTEAYEIFDNKEGNPNVSVFWMQKLDLLINIKM